MVKLFTAKQTSARLQEVRTAAHITLLLTYVSPPRFNDYSAPAASLLLCLCHALPCLLVGIVSSTHGDLILYASQAIQLDIAVAARERQWKRFCQHCKQARFCHHCIAEVVVSE